MSILVRHLSSSLPRTLGSVLTLTIGSVAALAVADLVAPAAAHAADCAAPYTLENLLGDMVAAEGHLRGGAAGPAKDVALKMEAGLGCMEAKLPRPMVARTFRVIGAGLLGSGDARGKQWFTTAKEVEPGYSYGMSELPGDSPIRGDYQAVSGDGSKEGPDKDFTSGKFMLDGKTIDSPEATPGRPHLLQRDEGGITSWVIDGSSFPDEVLADKAPAIALAPPVPIEAPKEKKPKKVKEPKEPKVKEPKPEKEPKVAQAKEPKEPKEKKAKPPKNAQSGGTVTATRKRPWEKTPLMIGGGVLMGVGGGIYYLAAQRRSDFDASQDLAEVDELQGQINRLVILSAAVTAVGAGTLTWGVILDGGTPVPAVQFRW